MENDSTGNDEDGETEPLHIDFKVWEKRQPPGLSNIGYRLARIGEDFCDALMIVNPLHLRIGRDISKSEPDPVILTEDEKRVVKEMQCDIENKLAIVTATIEWCREKKPPNLPVVVREINETIKVVGRNAMSVNCYVDGEPWFDSWQGADGKDNIHKRIQLIYKEYVEAVIGYFERTDEEHEKTKSNPDKNERVGKAPVVVNVLRPEALRPPSPG